MTPNQVLIPSWMQQLEAIAGAQQVRADPSWCQERVRTLAPPVIAAAPQDRAALCELLRFAAAEKLSVAPCGRGTKRGMGGITRRADLAISLEHFNRVVEYPSSDLTITVEAGIPIQTLRETLTRQGQMLPLDVPFAGRATLGGTIAANLSGPRRLGYGGWRDVVLGLQFTTADGKLAKGGGKVVKNVAGYDLPKLLIGSFGTLGILTEVSLKLFPIPPATATFVFGFTSAQAAAQAARAIQNSPFFPQALELFDAAAAELSGAASTLGSAYNVLAAIAGPPVVIERARRDLPALLRSSGAQAAQPIEGAEESKLWNALSELTPAFLTQHAGGTVVKASLPLLQIAPFVSEAGELARRANLFPAAGAQAGLGIVRQYLWPAGTPDANQTLAQTSEDCVALAERLGGRGVVEWFPAEFAGKMNPWGTLREDFALMRKIKAALDPAGILNPGRAYGGI